MYSAKIMNAARFVLTGTAILVLAASTTAQRPSNPAREALRRMQIKDMDQMLEYKLRPPSREEIAARAVVLKQIGEDFHELQALNNKMMSQAWSQKDLDYGYLSDMISRIRGKASRLKGNLNLPEPVNTEKAHSNRTIFNDTDFRGALMLLDRTIMNFVSNPLFQKPNTIELQQGVNARRDLETVIGLTSDLKKTASRLGKERHTP